MDVNNAEVNDNQIIRTYKVKHSNGKYYNHRHIYTRTGGTPGNNSSGNKTGRVGRKPITEEVKLMRKNIFSLVKTLNVEQLVLVETLVKNLSNKNN